MFKYILGTNNFEKAWEIVWVPQKAWVRKIFKPDRQIPAVLQRLGLRKFNALVLERKHGDAKRIANLTPVSNTFSNAVIRGMLAQQIHGLKSLSLAGLDGELALLGHEADVTQILLPELSAHIRVQTQIFASSKGAYSTIPYDTYTRTFL